MDFNNLYNPKTFSENFLHASKVSGLIFFVTVLGSLPFALFFPPASMVVLYLGTCVLSVYFFVCVFKIAVHGSLVPTPEISSKVDAKEWIAIQRAQDAYNDERKEKQKAEVMTTVGKVIAFVGPLFKKLIRLTVIAIICVVSLYIAVGISVIVNHVA